MTEKMRPRGVRRFKLRRGRRRTPRMVPLPHFLDRLTA